MWRDCRLYKDTTPRFLHLRHQDKILAFSFFVSSDYFLPFLGKVVHIIWFKVHFKKVVLLARRKGYWGMLSVSLFLLLLIFYPLYHYLLLTLNLFYSWRLFNFQKMDPATAEASNRKLQQKISRLERQKIIILKRGVAENDPKLIEIDRRIQESSKTRRFFKSQLFRAKRQLTNSNRGYPYFTFVFLLLSIMHRFFLKKIPIFSST